MSESSRSQRQISRRSILQFSAAAAAAGFVPLASLESSAALLSGAEPFNAVELPKDSRLGNLKDLDGYFPFTPPASKEEWAQRREFVRKQILVACGLWPMPERPAINATVHGRVERDDYTVDRVIFESSPGFLVTGSLYLPKNPTGKMPTILCPHGHWPNGRFHDHGEAQGKKEIETGAEQFEVGGRHPLQARCVQLARMGCMVFLYDMLGYADGGSLTQDLAHGFKKQRPELSSPERFGLFSAQSELRLLNAMGMQTWNSIRVLDWLSSRPDCDTTRIGVTGASGGGTQTFILAAIDDRITAAFPAVMVSTAMQGGCTCENASYLRVNTGNIEFAAMVAPRPIAMTGADDWTVEIETKGLPELKKHFAMMGVPDNVNAKYFKFPHNYNHPSRMMMYEFFNRTLNLGVKEIVERDYKPLTREETTVFTTDHPGPAKNEDTEVAILKAMDAASKKQIDALTPHDAASLKEYRNVIGGALDVMIGRSMPGAGEVAWEKTSEETRDGFLEFHGKLKVAKYGEELPATYLLPMEWNRRAVLWIDGEGKSKLFESAGKPIAPIAKLLKAGFAVGSVDLYLTGEFTEDGKPVSQMPVVANPREFAGYTLGYNHPLFSQRVHDVLSIASSTIYHDHKPESVHLVGVNGAGPVVAAAVATVKEGLASAAVDTKGYRFATITQIRDVNLLPGAVKYGDVPAMLAMCSSTKLAVAGETAETVPVTVAAFKAAGTNLTLLPAESSESAIVDWLLK